MPISSVGEVGVDGVHKQIFISDPQAGKIVVTGYDGTVLATRSGLPGVAGISLSPDAKTLYGAVRGADSIVSLDAETLTETARYDTGTGTGPKFLAYAGGLDPRGLEGPAVVLRRDLSHRVMCQRRGGRRRCWPTR